VNWAQNKKRKREEKRERERERNGCMLKGEEMEEITRRSETSND
jgi:hypothetical protein